MYEPHSAAATCPLVDTAIVHTVLERCEVSDFEGHSCLAISGPQVGSCRLVCMSPSQARMPNSRER